MSDRVTGIVFLGFFVVLLLAMHVIAMQTFSSVWDTPSLVFRASPILSLAAFGFLALGCFYLWRDR
ncbi:MAG TPA: hypothetical protein VGE07_00325 [Herpetosiphonaceae bacterium]